MGRRGGTAAALVAALLTACTAPPAAIPPPVDPPTDDAGAASLRWALAEDPTSLDPARIVRREEEVVVDALFDSLTALDMLGEPVPAAAVEWTADDDATEWRFTLDPAASWSDGTPVVAADVVRGFRRIADGDEPRPSLHAGLLADVEGFDVARRGGSLRGVTAIDDRTVAISLTRPVPELPVVLAHPALAPVPPLADEDPGGFGQMPVGNGPFTLGEPWIHNQFLRLVPTDQPTAALGELVFRIYADDESGEVRWADLAAGQVQVSEVSGVRRDEVAAVGAFVGSSDVTTVLLPSTDHPLLADVRFRRALSLLVPRAAVAARTNGARVPAAAIAAPGLLGAQDAPCRWCGDDVALAERLVAAAIADLPTDGAEQLPPLRLVTATDPVSTAVAEGLATAVLALDQGVQLRVTTTSALELPALLASEERPDLVGLSWAPLSPTTESMLLGLVGPDGVARGVTGWEPAALDDLLDRIAASAAVSGRVRAVQELERLLLDEAVVIPVHHGTPSLVVGRGVAGAVAGPDGLLDLAQLRVEAPGDEVRSAPGEG